MNCHELVRGPYLIFITRLREVLLLDTLRLWLTAQVVRACDKIYIRGYLWHKRLLVSIEVSKGNHGELLAQQWRQLIADDALVEGIL